MKRLKNYEKGGKLIVHELGQKRAIKSGRHKKKYSRPFLTPALLKEGLLQVAIFLEILSGVGRLGRSIKQTCGWSVLLWDLTLGPYVWLH